MEGVEGISSPLEGKLWVTKLSWNETEQSCRERIESGERKGKVMAESANGKNIK